MTQGMKYNFAVLAGYGGLAKYCVDRYENALIIATTKNAFNELHRYRNDVIYISIFSVGKIISKLKKLNITKIAFVGKLDKKLLFRDIRFDFTALKALAKIRDFGDNSLMNTFGELLTNNGIDIISQREIYSDLISDCGILVPKKALKSNIDGMLYAFKKAKEIANLDIGQSIVVAKKSVVAVEASEGTDEMISRAGRLISKSGILVKVAKDKHNGNFDLPVIGPDTAKVCAQSGIEIIVIECGQTLLFEKDILLLYLKDKKIGLVSVKDEKDFYRLW